MQSRQQIAYWRKNLRFTILLLLIWFLVTFVCSWYAKELNEIEFIGPLGFYMGAQGALIIYLAIVGVYALYMNRMDRQFGVREGGGSERR